MQWQNYLSLSSGAVLLLSVSEVQATPTIVNLGTSDNSASWLVTGGGAVDAPSFPMINGYSIGITSEGGRSSTFATGGSDANFDRFWYADNDFYLPAGATDVSLIFSGLDADDRVVLELNGTILGDYFLNGSYSNPPLTGAGVMAFPPGLPDVSYVFTGTAAGTITSGFVYGGTNDLRLVVNNTDLASLTAPTVTFQNGTDGTDAGLTAELTYTAVPEPTPGCLLLITCAGLTLRRKHRSA
jgi:hypothetical protein